MFSCPLCVKELKTRRSLERHTRTQTKEKPYKCLICLAIFACQGNLQTHSKSAHEGLKTNRRKGFECYVCGYKCSESETLTVHLRKHTGERPFPCNILGCGYKAKSEANLKRHLRGFHCQERRFPCSLEGCDYKAKTSVMLKKHLKTHSNEKPFACKVQGCNFTCKVKYSLKSHSKIIHSDERPFKCSTCDFQTKRKSSLTEHQRRHSKIYCFQCPALKCNFVGYEKKQVKLHFDRKHKEKAVLCTVPGCNFRCGSITLLKAHSVKHELPILKCPGESCNFSTRIPTSLRTHISRMHVNLNPGTFVVPRKSDPLIAGPAAGVDTLHCRFPSCDYKTEFPHRYDLHITRHNEEGNRKYFCTFCSFKFTQLIHLRTHVRKHTGEKPYSCSHCDYACMYHTGLASHAQRVHGILVIARGDKKQYESNCRTCNKTCSSYSEFVLHSLSHLQPVVVLERLKLHVL